EIKIEFNLQKYAQRTGELLIFPASYWKVFLENPFVEETRENPICISYGRTETDSIYVALPVGYTIDRIPDPISIAEPFGEFELSFKAVDSRKILITRYCHLNGDEISGSQNGNIRDFIARMLEKEAENVVLTRL
ncbi:MAG TPA: hypothetical protein VJC03_01575, partial [bacterium]|nr:hypothetical protein [bacterium]